jgi:hypothetical protein
MVPDITEILLKVALNTINLNLNLNLIKMADIITNHSMTYVNKTTFVSTIGGVNKRDWFQFVKLDILRFK